MKGFGRAFLFFVAVLPTFSLGYNVGGNKWLGGEAIFNVSIPGFSASGVSWQMAVVDALNAWTEHTVFDFTVVEEAKEPCADDGYSSIGFTEDMCGSEFGANTLAVTFRRLQAQELGPPNIIEADVVINSAKSYNVFDGPPLRQGTSVTEIDFKRIALHEIGHVIGLDHEEAAPSIMSPTLGNLFELQEDDIKGVKALYSGLKNCKIKKLSFGTYTEYLRGNDCTVQELTVGGTDKSFIDLYQFEVPQETRFSFTATSKALDPVLLIATTELEYLAVDSTSVADCNSILTRTLSAGSYFLMVNTYDRPIKPDCGTSGDYTMSVKFSSEGRPRLGPPVSLLGSFIEANFSGGITADGGNSFSNVFKPHDSLDITANINIDANHVGKSGFFVIAALLPNQTLMLNEKGQFVDVGTATEPLVVFRRKILEESEQLAIAKGLVPEHLGIFKLEANIYVGYGLDADPDEIYYHTIPVNLIVQGVADIDI